MSTRIYIKIFWVILLVMIAALAGHTMNIHPTPDKLTLDNREAITAAPYNYGTMPPVSLGEIKNANNAYVYIKLRFRVDSTEDYPNVFQTAPVNRGMRMEISGSTAAIVVPDLLVPGGLRGLTLTTTLKTAQWYALEVEALNGAFVHAKLDGQSVATYTGTGLAMETTQLLAGGGFDASRAFRGQIENISVIKGNRPKAWMILPYSISLSQWMLIFLCSTAFLMTLPRRSHIAKLAQDGDTTPTTSVLVDQIAIYGLALAFIALGLLSIQLFGKLHLGLSKWIAHMMLPVSAVTALLAMKRQSYEWQWARWPLGLLFLGYSAAVINSVGYKEHAYDIFILSMCLFSPIAFALSLSKIRLGLPLPKIDKKNLVFTSIIPIVISVLFLAISWCSLVTLTNWQAFRQACDDNFGLSVVGAFLVLRAVFAILFELPNIAKTSEQNLCIPGRVKPLLSRVYLDVVVIAVFFWISFRHDSLFLISESGNPVYHWEYYVGVVQGIRNGGWLLWDTPSQYGFLNVLLASLVPSASAWQAFYIFQGALLFLVSTGIYLAARRYTSTSVFQRLAIFAIVFMALFFADPELIGPYPFPSSSVVRFFCVYALVLVAWFIPKFGMRQTIALSIVWSLTVIWSAESAIYGTAIFLFILVALIQTNTTKNHPFALAGKYIGVAATCLTTTMVVIFAFYEARLGVAPDLSGYYEHALGYAGGFGYVPFPLSGPGNLLFLVFVGISVLCIRVIQRGGADQENLAAPLAAMAGCIWGISTYYIGRPVPQNITAMLPLITMVVYLTILLSKRTNVGVYALPIKAVAFPLLFLVLIPLFNLKWLSNLPKIQSFSSDVSTKLPKVSDELQQLLFHANPLADTPVVYYGDDAAPPIFSGDYAWLNKNNWLPIPLQLLEPPVSEARRSLYLNRYICRNQPHDGIIINRKGDAIELRLQGFLHELRQFYRIEEIISGNAYTLYRFSKINLQNCQATADKQI